MDADHGDWLTWPEAAELVGCRVPTIDWHTRSGRIESRAHHGNRPTLKRESVEEFALWWAERRARRKAQRADLDRRDTPPPTGSWLTTAQAGDRLGMTATHVRRMGDAGRLETVKRGRRVWVTAASVETMIETRSEWVSIRTAAEILGRNPRTVQRWAEAGRFDRRPGVGRAVPTLSRESVALLQNLGNENDAGSKRLGE